MSALITEGPEFVKYLDDLLGAVSYPSFETVKSGNISVGGILFQMRLGLHLKRPIQAIMACNQFIRMRRITNIGLSEHEVVSQIKQDLDATNPDNCWFPYQRALNPSRSWHPCWVDKPQQQDSIILDNAALINHITRRRDK